MEAVLFAASQPLRASDIADICGVSPDAVRRELRRLAKEYEERGTAYEIAKIGQRYSLQLRKGYEHYALPFAAMEIPPDVLRTASIIAYNQPILQSDLVKMLGSGVYERVRTLRQMGLVTGGDAAKQGIGIITEARMKQTWDMMVANKLIDPSKVKFHDAWDDRFVRDLKVMP